MIADGRRPLGSRGAENYSMRRREPALRDNEVNLQGGTVLIGYASDTLDGEMPPRVFLIKKRKLYKEKVYESYL